MSTNDSIDETPVDSIETLNAFAIKSKILNGELRISNKRGTSKVWDIFGKIENLDGVVFPSMVICRQCNNVYKFNSKSTSNLVKHKCYSATIKENKNSQKIDVDSATKKLLTKDITEWVVVDSRPFHIVADAGFEKVSKQLISIGAKYGPNVNMASLLPNPTTLSRNVNDLYALHFEKIKTEIATYKQNGFGLATDLWTVNFLRNTYIAVTIHFIKEHTVVSRLLGM